MTGALRFAAVLALLLLPMPAARAADTRISLAGAGVYSRPFAINSANKYTGRWGSGGGILHETLLFRWLGLELGGFYVPRKFEDSLSGVLTSHNIQSSLALRIWLGRWVSIAGGGYASVAVAELEGPSGLVASYHEYGMRTADYGYLGSARFSVPIGKSVAFFADARFTRGARNVSRIPGVSIYFTDAHALLGFSIGGPSKR